ncbi:MAG: phosphomannomutase/phosphoglucomutase, partial [Treponema sp.]|nr:phosphomannomutase/phosphoglucomutase [Treponema sp.]
MSSKDIFKLQNGNDIRGVAVEGVAGESVNLTPNICTGISHAFSFWLSRKTGKPLSELTIALGRDSRISGESLLNACVKGITNLGCTAINCGLATTPAMFMSLVFPETNYDGAIMVTASHLPYNRNGLKFFSKDGALESIDIKNILQLTRPDNDAAFYAAAKSFDILSLYSKYLRKKICESLNSSESSLPLKDLHIVVDAGNGAAGFFANKVLSSLGCNTSGSQFLEADGMFPNHIPNPENKEAMLAIKKAVVENHADLGIIFDTDGDRMSCVLGNGIEVNREAAIALFSAILAPDFPKSTIVTDSVTSDRLTNFLENILGLKHLRHMRG